MKDLASAVQAALAKASAAPGPVSKVPPTDLATVLDATLLRPDATEGDLRLFCEDAFRHPFASVCVNPVFVPLAVGFLGSGVRVGTVAGFPLGASSTAAKVHEIRAAADEGASEIDVVLHIGALKGKDYDRVAFELAALTAAARKTGMLIKVILETPLLTDDQKAAGTLLVKEAGADFVKTSTGFAPRPGASDPDQALCADVRILRAAAGPELGVKAAGGIRTYEQTVALLHAGATRIGTSHAGAIMEQVLLLSLGGEP